MNKAIISLLDTNKKENIRLAALLIPKEAYSEGISFKGRLHYQLRIEPERSLQQIKLLKKSRNYRSYEWILYQKSLHNIPYIDTNWSLKDYLI